MELGFETKIVMNFKLQLQKVQRNKCLEVWETTCSLGIGLLKEAGKGPGRESGARSPKELWILFCK